MFVPALGHPQEADLHLLCQVHFSGKNLPEPPSPWGWFNAVVCAPVVEPSERKCSGTGLVQMDVEVLYADLLIYFKQCSRNIIVFPRKSLEELGLPACEGTLTETEEEK